MSLSPFREVSPYSVIADHSWKKKRISCGKRIWIRNNPDYYILTPCDFGRWGGKASANPACLWLWIIILEWRSRLFAGYVVIRPGRVVLMYSTVVHEGDCSLENSFSRSSVFSLDGGLFWGLNMEDASIWYLGLSLLDMKVCYSKYEKKKSGTVGKIARHKLNDEINRVCVYGVDSPGVWQFLRVWGNLAWISIWILKKFASIHVSIILNLQTWMEWSVSASASNWSACGAPFKLNKPTD